MLDFDSDDSEFVEVKFKGEVHKINRPNNKQIKQYTVSIKDDDKGIDAESVLVDFLGTLGLRQEVYEQLTPQQVAMILKELYRTEKN